MKIYVVGKVLKDVYLNLDTQKEHLESDKNGVKWLDLGFDGSEHHFFGRTSSLGGAAVSLEVLEKMGVPAEVIGSDLRYGAEGLTTAEPVGAYRYILVADGQVSYLAPEVAQGAKFVAPTEPVEWILVDRSANLSQAAAEQLIAYLDISSETRLALYVQNPDDPCYKELAARADLVFIEGERADLAPEKTVYLSETELSYLETRVPVALERVEMMTHLSIFSIAAATILGGYVQGKTLDECLRLSVANLENARLDAVLPLSEMEKIAARQQNQLAGGKELELIAANLMLPGKGILAADESGGSIKRKFAQYGVADTYENRRSYRNIFFTTPQLERFVNGVILFDETTRQTADNGQNFVDYLTARRVIPGIKVDQGLEYFDQSIETYTRGLEGLAGRLREYYARGLRFAKWRAALEIRVSNGGEIITPSEKAIAENCRILAEYAAECQRAGLVPMVEPEVVYNGYYSLGQCAEVTGRVLDTLFQKLRETGVNLRACILKVNMVINGKNYGQAASATEVGVATAEVLKAHVPEELAGVAFLSGGQTAEQATANLAEVEKQGPFPWPVTFSFARALQEPALAAWRGDPAKTGVAQEAFLARLKANTEALLAVDFGE